MTIGLEVTEGFSSFNEVSRTDGPGWLLLPSVLETLVDLTAFVSSKGCFRSVVVMPDGYVNG